jgi:iron complex transport system permease protein
VARQGPREDEISPAWTIGTLLGLALLALVWAPFWGVESIPLGALWGNVDDFTRVDILWELRIPRVVAAFLAGMALATGGMVFQAVFRNPLATPYTLGLSSGAALGAAVAIQAGWAFTLLGIPGVTVCAFVGAGAAIMAVYALTARCRQGNSTTTMLLAGVAVSFFFSSLILLLQYLCDPGQAFRMLRWVMGGLDRVVSFTDVLNILPFVVAGCLITWYLLMDLNLLATGEDFAFSRGVNVSRTKALLFVGVSLMVGAVVAVCGPIGFVGLVAPHVCRLLLGSDHRLLFPASVLFGGSMLVFCDAAGRLFFPLAELPVGIITALLGGPFFLWLLLTRKQDLGPL